VGGCCCQCTYGESAVQGVKVTPLVEEVVTSGTCDNPPSQQGLIHRVGLAEHCLYLCTCQLFGLNQEPNPSRQCASLHHPTVNTLAVVLGNTSTGQIVTKLSKEKKSTTKPHGLP
jgi:hypothetical protein